MKKIAVALATFGLTLATYAAYYQVMADSVTGTVAMPALEARIGTWAALDGKPTSIAGYGILDAPTYQWVIDYVVANTTPIGTTNEPAFVGWTNQWHSPLIAHLETTNGNPHGITASMMNAVTTNDFLLALSGLVSSSDWNSVVATLETKSMVSNKLDKSGGTMTGTLVMDSGNTAGGAPTVQLSTNGIMLRRASTYGDDTIWVVKGAEGTAVDDFLFKIRTVSGIPVTDLVWTADCDGHGSGMDADTLDGYQSSAFVFTSQYFNVTTGGQVKATSLKRVVGATTNEPTYAIAVNGTTNASDSNGLIDLGTIGGSDNTTMVTGLSIRVGTDVNNPGTNTMVVGERSGATARNGIALGYRASVTHPDAFVWSDGSSDTAFNSFTNNTFAVRAAAGVYFLTPAIYQSAFDGTNWTHNRMVASNDMLASSWSNNIISNAAVAAAALPSSGSGKMSGDIDFGGNSATNMADMLGIGGQSRGRISFEDSLLENFTSISASNASLGNLFVSGGVNIGGVTRTSWPGTGSGATQIIANIVGQAPKTSAYNEATATLTLFDLADNNSGSGTASGIFNSRILTESGTVATNGSDYAIGCDTATTNISLTLPDLSTNFASIVVRKFSNTNEVTILRGTNVAWTLYNDGSSVALDWWPQKTNWYWRSAP